MEESSVFLVLSRNPNISSAFKYAMRYHKISFLCDLKANAG